MIRTAAGGVSRLFVRTRQNLFGIRLTVPSIAFQEQDHVVAACATSALWSAFHGTSQLFHNPIPSPVEITRAAKRHLPVETRVLPNRGLTGEQMAHAIRHLGLEPFLISVGNEYVLKKTVYAYLRAGIPVVLGVILRDTSDIPGPGFPGRHAVTVTGFSLGRQDAIPLKETSFFLKASRIDKLYAHDDQVGPFARMTICSGTQADDVAYLTTSWISHDGQRGRILAEPDILLVPLYHKIRIPYGLVHDVVLSFHENVISPLVRHRILKLEGNLEWDIYLTTVNAFKGEILTSPIPDGEIRRSVLSRSMPKYLWRATATCCSRPVLDLLFDATDLEQAPFLALSVKHDPAVFDLLELIAAEPQLLAITKSDLEWKVLGWFETGRGGPLNRQGQRALRRKLQRPRTCFPFQTTFRPTP